MRGGRRACAEADLQRTLGMGMDRVVIANQHLPLFSLLEPYRNRDPVR
jgi:hypothetical protein